MNTASLLLLLQLALSLTTSIQAEPAVSQNTKSQVISIASQIIKIVNENGTQPSQTNQEIPTSSPYIFKVEDLDNNGIITKLNFSKNDGTKTLGNDPLSVVYEYVGNNDGDILRTSVYESNSRLLSNPTVFSINLNNYLRKNTIPIPTDGNIDKFNLQAVYKNNIYKIELKPYLNIKRINDCEDMIKIKTANPNIVLSKDSLERYGCLKSLQYRGIFW